MLSDKVINGCKALIKAQNALRNMVEEESDGLFGVCTLPYIQLWADPDHQHDLKDLEALVGPIKYAYTTEDGCNAYRFTLGGVPCVILMPENTSDSRSESDDVSANTEA